jgi:hypothetical protein
MISLNVSRFVSSRLKRAMETVAGSSSYFEEGFDADSSVWASKQLNMSVAKLFTIPHILSWIILG